MTSSFACCSTFPAWRQVSSWPWKILGHRRCGYHGQSPLDVPTKIRPRQIDQVTKGQLPKDLSDNLKRIEKLAKQLRSQIIP